MGVGHRFTRLAPGSRGVVNRGTLAETRGTVVSGSDLTVEQADSGDLAAADLADIRRLMNAAFGDRFSEDDWKHAIGGRHFFIRGPEGIILSHGSVVARKLETVGYEFSTGYVEAVATQPEYQRRGFATAIMGAVAEFIRGRFELGALSGDPDFYERLGWSRWRGATWCRDGDSLTRTADEDGSVLVLPTGIGRPLDLEGDIAVEWRSGDVW